MKILMISPVNPFPANTGGAVRIVQLFRGLQEFHDVTLTFPWLVDEDDTPPTTADEKVLPIACQPSSRARRTMAAFSRWPYHVRYYYSSDFHQVLRQLLQGGGCSLIYCHFIYTLPYVVETGLPVVLDQQNVDREYWHRKVVHHWSKRSLGRYLMARMNLSKTMRFEKAWLRRVHGIVSVSNRDSEITKVFAPNPQTRFIVAPNGVDVQHYARRSPHADSFPDSLVLGFLGSLDLELNQEAAFAVCKDILPRVRERLSDMNVSALIIGRNPPQELIHFADGNASHRITITGTVDDVLPYLQQVDILVLPLRSGAGTKLRVLEAMAAGVCVVGSELALVGIDGLVYERHAFKADRTDEFVQTICFLAHNPDIRRRVAAQAIQLAVNRYSWRSISQQLSEELVDLCSTVVTS